MLHRIFVLTLLLVSVLGQEEANTDPAEDVSQPEPLSLAERPRGERAEEGDSPPPRRQRQGCQRDEKCFIPFPSFITGKSQS